MLADFNTRGRTPRDQLPVLIAGFAQSANLYMICFNILTKFNSKKLKKIILIVVDLLCTLIKNISN